MNTYTLYISAIEKVAIIAATLDAAIKCVPEFTAPIKMQLCTGCFQWVDDVPYELIMM